MAYILTASLLQPVLQAPRVRTSPFKLRPISISVAFCCVVTFHRSRPFCVPFMLFVCLVGWLFCFVVACAVRSAGVSAVVYVVSLQVVTAVDVTVVQLCPEHTGTTSLQHLSTPEPKWPSQASWFFPLAP